MDTAGLRVAFDVGGTFTDVVIAAGDGAVATYKMLTLSDSIGADVSACIGDALVKNSHPPIDTIVHGTTIASNTVVEGKGSITGLLCTKGFRDLLEIREGRRPPVYDIFWERTPPLIPRRRRLEVTERLLWTGEILTPMAEDEVRRALHSLRDQGTEAIAVCFLHSYANPIHERRAMELVREVLPAITACASYEILPEAREYGRTSTTAINAYLMRTVAAYLDNIQEQLGQYRRQVLVMQSNGGIMTLQHARQQPVRMIESGPAAGVLAAAALTREADLPKAVSFDMGGTTVKACLIENGEAAETHEGEVGAGINAAGYSARGAGYALRVPAFDIAELGAGGGSIAYLDEGMLLRVGPHSAGAAPGPVCYGRGGTAPTVTDANVVLGYMNPERIAGGTVAIDARAAHAAIGEQLARPLSLPVAETAYGIHRVANATMARAIRSVTSERGRDPREYTLIAFGGAGPIHAAALAQDVGIQRVYAPLFPGLFSSIGLLFADLRYDGVRSLMLPLDQLAPGELIGACRQLAQELATRLQNEAAASAPRFERWVDLRYLHQESELSFRLPDDLDTDAVHGWLRETFSLEHRRNFGYEREGEPILVGGVRVKAIAPARAAAMREFADAFHRSTRSAPQPPEQVRRAYFGPVVGEHSARIMSRAGLLSAGVPGPAIIEEFDTTIVVPPGWRADLDRHANVVMTRV